VRVLDAQAREILDLLHQYDISYWLDSGTLLGLMREGQLLEDDEDIDLGVWSTEEPKIKELLPLIRGLGYVLYSASYNGVIFKHNFIPKKKGLRKIDINIFREFGSHAWCPMYYFKVNPGQKTSNKFRDIFLGSIKGGTRHLWKHFNSRVPVHVDINNFPWRTFLNIGTWWIPAGHFKCLYFNEEWQAFVPVDWGKYLEFRYGQWQQRDENWVFFRDDKGIREIQPTQLTMTQTNTLYGP
jgi:hypothetical protein